MKNFPNILIVGGTGRNVGKTEFVCNCIEHFSKSNTIIGLKITNHFHEASAKPYKITEELNIGTNKDSSRMLRAGASRVFYVQTDSEHLSSSFHEFIKMIPDDSIIICESNALKEVIKPGLYLIINTFSKTEMKESAKKLFSHADRIVNSDGISFSLRITDIFLTNKKWSLV